MFFNTPEYIFCPEKNVSHHTRHTTCSAPNFDENVPHTCPCTGNPELWQAVHFSTRYVCMNENTKIKENDKTEERLIEKTREIVLSTPAAKKNERKLRAIHPLSTSPFVRTVRVRRDLKCTNFSQIQVYPTYCRICMPKMAAKHYGTRQYVRQNWFNDTMVGWLLSCS